MIYLIVFGIIIIGEAMNNKIEIYINTEEDLLEKYNHKLVSCELIDYIIIKSKNIRKALQIAFTGACRCGYIRSFSPE